MTNDAFRKNYKKVPQDQKEKLMRFRDKYPYKHINVDGTDWEYISCGQGQETLLCLTSGFRVGEIEAFPINNDFGSEYRIISPTYPLLSTIEKMMNGIANILESENIRKVHLIGTSLGAIIAQCFFSKFPDKVDKVILTNALIPDQSMVKKGKMAIKLSHFLPYRFIRFYMKWRLFILKIYLFKMIQTNVPKSKHEFLRAYIKELFGSIINEEWFVCRCKLIIDFFEKYLSVVGGRLDKSKEVLILEADKDELIPESLRREFRKFYPRAQVNVIHDTRHMTVLINNEKYISSIKTYLSI